MAHSPSTTTGGAPMRALLPALWKDILIILVVAVLAAFGGAWAGYRSADASSTAQLLLAPNPLRENFEAQRDAIHLTKGEDEGELARMLAKPLMAKTAALLCTSDHVMRKTAERLNAEAPEGAPAYSPGAVRGATRYEITLDMETPYEVHYSPILRLTATAPQPAEAKRIANAWGIQCVEAGRAFHRLRQEEFAEMYQGEAQRIQEMLTKAETELTTFRDEHAVRLLEARRDSLVQDIIRAEEELRDINLDRVVSGNRQSDPVEPQLERFIETQEHELDVLNGRLAEAETKMRAIERKIENIEIVYREAVTMAHLAGIANGLDYSPMRVLSEGTEWGIAPMRRGMLFGLAGGFWALVLALVISVGFRLYLRPPSALQE